MTPFVMLLAHDIILQWLPSPRPIRFVCPSSRRQCVWRRTRCGCRNAPLSLRNIWSTLSEHTHNKTQYQLSGGAGNVANNCNALADRRRLSMPNFGQVWLSFGLEIGGHWRDPTLAGALPMSANIGWLGQLHVVLALWVDLVSRQLVATVGAVFVIIPWSAGNLGSAHTLQPFSTSALRRRNKCASVFNGPASASS